MASFFGTGEVSAGFIALRYKTGWPLVPEAVEDAEEPAAAVPSTPPMRFAAGQAESPTAIQTPMRFNAPP